MEVADVHSFWQDLRNQQASMVSQWSEVARYVLPDHSGVVSAGGNGTQASQSQNDSEILSSTAQDANEALAAGTVELCSPISAQWFRFQPSPERKGVGAVEDWLNECNDIIDQALRDPSNFYTVAQQLYLQRGCYGITALSVELDENGTLQFQAWDPGSFVIAENAHGKPDVIIREISFTARQAIQKFGDQAGKKAREAMAKKKPNEPCWFLHAIMPSDEKKSPWPIEDLVITRDDKEVVRRGGHETMPVFASRYLKSASYLVYGRSPAMNALRDIRRLEKMELNVATAARLINNPRIITPADFRGVVDLRPGGQTVGSIKGKDNNPYEWASGGDPRFLIDERNRKEEIVESRFHRQLFTQFSELERQITAREVEAREREKLMRFSPSFTLLVNELLTPMLQRVFMLLFKAGKLPPHPAEAEVTDSANQTYMLFPSIVQTSRMAQAITAAQTEGMMALGEMFAPFPETFDNLDRDKLFRHTARARHLGAFLFSESDVENKRRADAEAAAQQQQMAMLLEASKSKPVAEAGIAALQQQ